MRPNTIETLMEKIERVPESGCWLWTASLKGGGYGQAHFGNRNRLAHTVFYRLLVGPVPEGLQVCHRCDVRCCCNPNHLFLGTAQDNQLDCLNKRRHGTAFKPHCKRGHEFNSENTKFVMQDTGFPHRICMVCRKAADKRKYARRKLHQLNQHRN